MTKLLRGIVKATEDHDPVARFTALEALRIEAQAEQDRVLMGLHPKQVAQALNITTQAASARRRNAQGRLNR